MSPAFAPAAARAVLFDLDGTLVDTAPDLARAANRVRTDLGLRALPLRHYRPAASGGARALLLSGAGMSPEHPDFARLREAFLRYYRADLSRRSRLFPGMGRFLRMLERRRIPWGIVTNKPQDLADPLLRDLRLAHRAACVIGARPGLPPKPAPDPLLRACTELALAPAKCVYLGDDRRDVDAARAAGMPALIAAWGYIAAGEDLDAWGADGRADSPAALPALWG